MSSREPERVIFETCERCGGSGKWMPTPWKLADILIPDIEPCDECGGTGFIAVLDDDDEQRQAERDLYRDSFRDTQ